MNQVREKNLLELLDEVKKELDANPRYRKEEFRKMPDGAWRKTGNVLKQNCTYDTTMKNGKKIFFYRKN